jgi:hypothetical protein
MTRWLTLLLFALLLAGCSSSRDATLIDINPNRTYNVQYDRVLDAVRNYAIREGYTLDRYETEFGTIIAHKTETRNARGPATEAVSHVIVFTMSVRRETPQRTNLNARYSFGGVHTARSPDDDDILALHYSRLYEYLDRVLGREH